MANGRTYKFNKLELTCGNRKLGQDTLIINFSSYKSCPSRRLGLCKVCSDCYTKTQEALYPQTLPYRERQKSYWLTSSKEQILKDFCALLEKFKVVDKNHKLQPLHTAIKYLRYSEAGDLHSQACIDKLSYIAKGLKKRYGIVTYGYTARMDLDFSKASFLVKGSSWQAKNGSTIVRSIDPNIDRYYENNTEYKVCKGNCRNCSYCKRNNHLNIVIPKH